MRQSIGNACMLFAVLLLFIIYYPIIEIYFFPKPFLPHSHTYSFAIEIDKIHVYAPIIPNVDPFNDRVYHDALTHGVALAKGTSMPGESGTTYIFAHSSDFPWRITRYNTIFYRLGELKNGDMITITQNAHTYKYAVTEQKTVWPWETQYLTQSKKTQLILQTCTPIGTALQRLLIFAKPV